MSGAAYATRDGHWHLQVIVLDGRQLIRIAHDTPALPGGHVPVHQSAGRRAGTVRTAHGYWVADVDGTDAVARYLPLSELEAVTL